MPDDDADPKWWKTGLTRWDTPDYGANLVPDPVVAEPVAPEPEPAVVTPKTTPPAPATDDQGVPFWWNTSIPGLVWEHGEWVPDPALAEPVAPETSPAQDDTATPHISNFGQYLITEHLDSALGLAQGKITLHDIMQNLPVDKEGQLTFGGDEELEDTLQLPDEIKAVQLGSGEIIKQFDGRFADIGHTKL
jgi:hypothetical protein